MAAAAALLRSVASKSKMLRPANSNQQGTAYVLVSVGMAAATGLRSGAGRLTTKMAHAPPPPPQYRHRLVHGRGIHNHTSPDPNPSTKKVLDALDMAANVSAGVGCIVVFGCAIYMRFWLRPKLKKLTAMIEDRHGKSSQHPIYSDASSVSHQTPTTPASAGHGNTTDKGTGVIDKLEAAVKTLHSHENRIKKLEAEFAELKIIRIKKLDAEIAELKIALDSARSQGKM